MDDREFVAQKFEAERTRLRGVAYRMLGSLSDADDAVQEAWLRLSRAGAGEIENLGGWLTTVVARICLDALRARRARSEEPMGPHVPDPLVARDDPAGAVALADSIGLALLVVLETLAPAERLAFVLHDLFGMPFDEIAPIVERTPTAARQLASRARRRVQGASPGPTVSLAEQRRVVDAFLAASRAGDFDALVAVLDPDVVLRADRGDGRRVEVRGSGKVAHQSLTFRRSVAANRVERRALVNGAPGLVLFVDGRPLSLVGFTVAHGKVVAVDIIADPARLAALALDFLGDGD